jgi:hypothetical protein
MRENYPDFLCMKCNAHICFLYFVTSNPGILHRGTQLTGSIIYTLVTSNWLCTRYAALYLEKLIRIAF